MKMEPSMKTSHLNKGLGLDSIGGVHPADSVDAQPHQYRHNSITALATSSGQKMQAAKRLDWRFLLPRPELGQVAFWGSEKSLLAEALALYSEKLTLLQRTHQNGFVEPKVTYDLVVLCNPTRELLQWAPTVLSATGSVYLEIQSLFWPQRWFHRSFIQQVGKRSLLTHPKDYGKILQQGGLAQTQTHWMWPSFDNTRKIIPLDAPNILSYVSAAQRQEKQNFKRLLKTCYRRWLLESDWFSLLVPCMAITASSSSKQ